MVFESLVGLGLLGIVFYELVPSPMSTGYQKNGNRATFMSRGNGRCILHGIISGNFSCNLFEPRL